MRQAVGRGGAGWQCFVALGEMGGGGGGEGEGTV